MVTSVTSLGRSGVYDWLIQRVTAIVLAAYTIFLLAYFLVNGAVTYDQWVHLFSHTWMRIFSLMALLAMVVHAWVGLWCVLTDYVTERVVGSKALVIRLFFQVALGVVAVTYTVWGVQILWGL